MAQEWGVSRERSGYANCYELDCSGLKILNLNDEQYCICLLYTSAVVPAHHQDGEVDGSVSQSCEGLRCGAVGNLQTHAGIQSAVVSQTWEQEEVQGLSLIHIWPPDEHG